MKRDFNIKIQLVILFLLGVVACSPKVDTRGYTNDERWKQYIRVGESNRDDVIKYLGSPSTQSNYGDERWYYISSRKETYAFFEPEVVDQEVLVVKFDTSGLVTSVRRYDENDKKEFDYVSRTTPTEGHSLGFVEQIVGNIGRFNKDGTKTKPRTPRSTSGY